MCRLQCSNQLQTITRIWGLLTWIILIGVGVDLCFFHQVAGGFTVLAAVIVCFLETAWVITLFLQVHLRNENHPVYCCWDTVLWLDTWKKSIVYFSLAVILLAQPHRAWFATSAGLCLVVLGALYLCLMYQRMQPHPQQCLTEEHGELEEAFGLA